MVTATDPLLLLPRIGVGQEPPSAHALYRLHRAFVESVPYETIAQQLGRPPGITLEDAVTQVLTTGRGGYCFTMNGAFAALLRTLGYDCTLHVAGVQVHGGQPAISANHLALVVGCEGRRFYADVGTGDGLYEPLPLVEGSYKQGPFTYWLGPSDLCPGGWRFDHDARGAFAGLDFDPSPATMGAFAEQHRLLSTSPDSGFVRTLSAFRRRPDHVVVLRSLSLGVVPETAPSRVVASEDELLSVLVDVFGMSINDLSEQDRQTLWDRASRQHEEWVAGRATST